MTNFSLSAPRRQLLETMQRTNFGRIERLEIRNGEPVLSPPPRIVKDVKLGESDEVRPELAIGDFTLKRQHIELLESFTSLGNGMIDAIVIKNGLPFRLLVEQRV